MPAVSVAQQHFMGMVHAAQKGTLKSPSPAVARAAKSMTKSDARDFAATKHKGLPQHVEKEASFVEKLAMMDMGPAPQHHHQHVPDPYDQPMFGNDIAAHIQDPLQRQDFILAVLHSLHQEQQHEPHHHEHMPHMPHMEQPEHMKFAGSILQPMNREASKPTAVTQIPRTQQQLQPQPQKMVLQPAPAVPNPIVPRSQSAMPMPGQKTAGCCTVKPAPRYTSSGKKGKKAMPQPYARQLKHAAHIDFAESLVKEARIGADQVLPQGIMPWMTDILMGGTPWAGTRAGRAQHLAEASGQDASFNVRHPMTSNTLAALGGAIPGTALGAGIAYMTGHDVPTGGGLGALGGAVGGGLLMNYLRHGEMNNIADQYDKTEDVNNQIPEFSTAATYLAPFRGPHRSGQMEAYNAIDQDKPVPGSFARDLAYAGQYLPNPVGTGVGALHGWGQNMFAANDAANLKNRQAPRRLALTDG